MGPLPVFPVCLDFDGVEVDPREAVSTPSPALSLGSAPTSVEVVPGEASAGSPAMSLGSALPSVEVVPESVSGEVSAGSPAMSLGSALAGVEVMPESVSGEVSAGSGKVGSTWLWLRSGIALWSLVRQPA
jgi:hypothetical protein